MEYLDVISLEEGRNLLKVDDTLSQDDALITRIIKASLQRIEVLTNIHLIDKSKTYYFDNYIAIVYDYPINSITSPTDATEEKKTSYSLFCDESDNKELVLNVGYTDATDIPNDLLEVAYEMMDIMYYNKENKLSMLSEGTIHNYRRFII